MQLKKTLYDLLELSPHASQESISAAYERLAAKKHPDHEDNRFVPNAQADYILLKQAYETLSNPMLRRAYDEKLKEPEYPVIETVEPSFWTSGKILAGLLLALVVGIAYQNHARDKALETTRLKLELEMAEQKRLETESQEKYASERQENAARSEARQKQYDEERRQRQMQSQLEADRRRGDQVSRELAYAERDAKREAERKAETEARKERDAKREEENRARQAQMENERKLRELDRKLMQRP